ncbi:MAG: carbon-nitrogen hydrolase family protein [Pseudomonadota bacterium]
MTSPRAKVLGGRDAVKVCLAQISPAYMSRDETAKRAVNAIEEASANGAELIVFPEVWLAGYPYWTEGWESGLQQWAGGRIRFFDEAVLVPSPVTEMIGQAAAKANMYVVVGCNEIDPRPGSNTIYNTLLFFDRHGDLMGRHRKLMPTFSERLYWGAGDGSDIAVYDTDIGRIGGLICGENIITPLRAAVSAMGEDFHVAVFPGSFALHTGPRLEEWDMSGNFWGHFVTRTHSLEAGCFTLSVSAYVDPADIPDDFPQAEHMHIDYARGGSQVVSPLGVPIAGPVEGSRLIYATCEAWMIKATKAIVDTGGHYGRPDVVRTILNQGGTWQVAGDLYESGPISRDALKRSADQHEIEEDKVEQLADQAKLMIGKDGA